MTRCAPPVLILAKRDPHREAPGFGPLWRVERQDRVAAGTAKGNSAADGQSPPVRPGRRPESIRKPPEGKRIGVRVEKQIAKRVLQKKPKPRSEPC